MEATEPNVWYHKLHSLLEFSPDNIIISQQLPSQSNKGSRQFVYLPYDEKKVNQVFLDDQNLYELLPAGLPRRFAVDIDIKPSHKNYKRNSYEEIVHAMTTVVGYCLAKTSDYPLDKDNIVVSVVKKDDRKQSLHLLYPVYFENQVYQLHFAKFVEMTILEDKDRSIEDAVGVLSWCDPEGKDPPRSISTTASIPATRTFEWFTRPRRSILGIHSSRLIQRSRHQ